MRRFLRGWTKNLSNNYKQEKEKLLSIIDEFELKAEGGHLKVEEQESLRNANEKITKLRRDEETKWAQREKVKHVQGGNNAKYCHLIATGQHRKMKIF
jgi:hypothetical protein